MEGGGVGGGGGGEDKVTVTDDTHSAVTLQLDIHLRYKTEFS